MDDRAFDPYVTLGVPSTATQVEITRAFRRKLLDTHPDTRSTLAPGVSAADEQLHDVLTAYALLRDTDRRTAYDQNTARMPATTTAGPAQPGPIVIPVRHRGRNSQPKRPVRVVPVDRRP